MGQTLKNRLLIPIGWANSKMDFVRLYQLIYEAIIQLAWKQFLPWLNTNHLDDLEHCDETLGSINNVRENPIQ